MLQEYKLPPRAHQLEALRRSRDRVGFGWLMEMGTGKTKVAIDEAARLWRAGAINTLIVTAPKGVCSNWTRRELPAHLPDDVAATTVVALYRSGASNAGLRQLNAALDPATPGLTVVVVNGEGLSAPGMARRVTEQLLRTRRCLWVLDESTLFKEKSAARTKWVLSRAPLAKYRRILTGFSVPNGPMDAWSQFEFLSPGCLGHTSWYSFRARYSVLRRFVPQGGCPAKTDPACGLQPGRKNRVCPRCRRRIVEQTVSYRNVEELAASTARHSYRVTKEECLDLPPKVYQMRDVELSDDQRRVYRAMVADAQAELDGGGWASAEQVITQLLRLHQVTCGFVVDEAGVHRPIDNELTTHLDQVIEESAGGKLLVWCTYQYEVERYVAHLRAAHGAVSTVHHYGRTSGHDRDEAVTRLQEDARCRFFVATTQTGGWGITLTAAQNVLYMSNSFDLEKRVQSEDRAHRIGQTGAVNYTDLVTPQTLSERVLLALRRKMDVGAAVMQDGPRAWVV